MLLEGGAKMLPPPYQKITVSVLLVWDASSANGFRR